MRRVPSSMTNAWRSGHFVGDARPTARVVVSNPNMRLYNYSHPAPKPPVASDSGIPFRVTTQRRNVVQTYGSYLWSDQKRPKELPNIKSVSWTRGASQDVGQCTIEVWNCEPMPVGAIPDPASGDPSRAGYYNYRYGGQAFSARWGQSRNEWFGWIMPDNIITVFEGYGITPGVAPEKDEKLVQTGVWRIRDVEMTTNDRVMRLTCEDLGSLLTDHIVYPPVIPDHWYPLTFGPIPSPQVVHDNVIQDGGPLSMRITKTSNAKWNGDRAIRGHMPHHAVDGNASTYWLSVGNAHPSRGFAFEYIEFALRTPSRVGEVNFRTAKAGYTAYLSVSQDGGRTWMGSEIIGWRSEGIGRNEGNIPFIMSQVVHNEGQHGWRLNVDGVTHIRVTLGNLQNFGGGGPRYRGAFREISARGLSMGTVAREIHRVPKDAQAGSHAGIARDFTDVVKMCLAWAGLYWPRSARRQLSDGSTLDESPRQPDPVLAADGRVWGDLENTGTIGIAPLKSLDKQTLRQVIQNVADIVGFVFWFDEFGSAIWRLPNLYKLGNNVSMPTPGRTAETITLDEGTSLLSLRTRLTSRNVREWVCVGNPLAPTGQKMPQGVSAKVAGWNPNPTGLRRVSGWLDQGFVSKKEAQVMADLMAVRGAFSYRRNELVIPAYPAIQVDDQVRVFERTTTEGYLHYVDTIQSQNDLTTGEWTYTLSTHWLGDNPDGVWAFHAHELSEPAKAVGNLKFSRSPFIGRAAQ